MGSQLARRLDALEARQPQPRQTPDEFFVGLYRDFYRTVTGDPNAPDCLEPTAWREHG
jgi:hypothetical protein